MTADSSELRGPRIVLRRPVAQDVDTRLKLGRHREIVEAFGGTFNPAASMTRAEAEEEIRFIERHDYAWVIDAGGFIGHVRFHNLDHHDRRAALAIGINDPASLGKGLGTEAIGLVLPYIFDKGFHRVSARVLSSNARAIACYRKCGFREEGREREAAFVNGTWQDDVIMGVLDREIGPA